GTYAVNFYVRPSDGASHLAPGYFKEPTVEDVTWAINVGTLSDGAPAGTLRWSTNSVNPSLLLDASSLNYVAPVSDEITTYNYSDGTIKYIGTSQIQIYVRRNPGAGNGYSIEVYGPAVGFTYSDPVADDWTFASTYTTLYQVFNQSGYVAITRLDQNSSYTEGWALLQSGGTTTLNKGDGLHVVTATSSGTSPRTESVTVADSTSTA